MIKTLFTIAGILCLSTNMIFSQSLYSLGNWPNSNWTITGAHSGANLNGNPTIHNNFKFNDYNAGASSMNQPAAESPTINLSTAHANGEYIIEIRADLVIGNNTGLDQMKVEYFDASSSSWVQASSTSGSQSGGSLGQVQNCTGMASLPTTQIDITNFTSLQLNGFKYRFKYNDNGGWEYGFCVKNPLIFSAIPCTKPSNQTAYGISQNSANLNWIETGAANAWQIELVSAGSNPSGNPTISNVGKPYLKTGLSTNSSYDYYVRAICGNGNYSPWEGPYTFTTLAQPCYSPSALFATNITTSSATLGWLENGSATKWDIEIVSGSLNATGIPTYSNITSNPYSVSGLSGSTTYRFYVRSKCSPGTSSWSGPYYFTTTISCPAPSNLFAFSITNTTAYLTWAENGTASQWDIEIVNSGSIPLGTPTSPLVNSNPYNATGLTINTAYDFYVRSRCGLGDESLWSGPYTFQTTNSTCDSPSGLGYSNLTSSSVDLYWFENGTASTWDIEIVFSGSTQTGSPTSSGVNSNPYSATNLLPSTAYDFYVRSDCGSTKSSWSGPSSFTTPQATTCPAPSNLSVSNIGDLEAEFSWVENGFANDWDIELISAGTTPSGNPTITSVSSPHVQGGLIPGTGYDFYVRANCGANYSTWTGPYNFYSTAEVTMNEGAYGIRVFPNPSNGLYTLETMNNEAHIKSIEVFDMQGRLVLTDSNFESKMAIDLSSEEKGVYTLKVKSEQGQTIHRLILE